LAANDTIWGPVCGGEVHAFGLNAFRGGGPTFNGDVTKMLTALNDTIFLWDISNGSFIKSYTGAHHGACDPIGFSHNGLYFFTLGLEDSSIRVWEVASGINTKTYKPYLLIPSVANLTPDGQHIVVGYRDGTILMLDVSKALDVEEEHPVTTDPLDLAVFPNPVNDLSSIKVSFPATDRYVLKVFDLLGVEKATLYDGLSSQGSHTIPLGSAFISDSPSGAYIVSLMSSKKHVSKVVFLAK
jgi:WD40 repeat protein